MRDPHRLTGVTEGAIHPGWTVTVDDHDVGPELGADAGEYVRGDVGTGPMAIAGDDDAGGHEDYFRGIGVRLTACFMPASKTSACT